MAKAKVSNEEKEQVQESPRLPVIRQASIVPSVETPFEKLPTNIDLATPEGKAMAINALGSPDLEMPDDGKVTILATHFLLHVGERLNPDTGEVDMFPRLVLFNQHGETFVTTSCVVPHRLKAMLALYSLDDWKAGIPIVIQRKKCKSGIGYYHDIRICPGLKV